MKILPTSSILSSLMFLLIRSKVSMVVSRVCVSRKHLGDMQNKFWYFPPSDYRFFFSIFCFFIVNIKKDLTYW